MDPQTIEHEALSLPQEDRAKLAQKLLLSLDPLSEGELNQTWLIEADRRRGSLIMGMSSPYPQKRSEGKQGHC